MNNHKIYIVADDNGFGWHPDYGKMVTPCIFQSEYLANEYIISVWVKFSEIKLNIFYKTGYDLIK